MLIHLELLRFQQVEEAIDVQLAESKMKTMQIKFLGALAIMLMFGMNAFADGGGVSVPDVTSTGLLLGIVLGGIGLFRAFFGRNKE
jgi:hypothetical protein